MMIRRMWLKIRFHLCPNNNRGGVGSCHSSGGGVHHTFVHDVCVCKRNGGVEGYQILDAKQNGSDDWLGNLYISKKKKHLQIDFKK